MKFVKAVLSLFSSTFRVGRFGPTLAVEVTTLLAFSSVEEATLIWDGLRLLVSSSSEGEEGLSSVVTSGSGLRISGALCLSLLTGAIFTVLSVGELLGRLGAVLLTAWVLLQSCVLDLPQWVLTW